MGTVSVLLVLASSLFGLSFGFVTPSLYNILANLAPSHLQSSILATGIGAGFLGQFLSPLILGGVLTQAGLKGVFYSCAVVAIALGLSLLIPLSPRSSALVEPTFPTAKRYISPREREESPRP